MINSHKGNDIIPVTEASGNSPLPSLHIPKELACNRKMLFWGVSKQDKHVWGKIRHSSESQGAGNRYGFKKPFLKNELLLGTDCYARMSEWFTFEDFIFLTGEAQKEVILELKSISCGYTNLREIELSKNQNQLLFISKVSESVGKKKKQYIRNSNKEYIATQYALLCTFWREQFTLTNAIMSTLWSW